MAKIMNKATINEVLNAGGYIRWNSIGATVELLDANYEPQGTVRFDTYCTMLQSNTLTKVDTGYATEIFALAAAPKAERTEPVTEMDIDDALALVMNNFGKDPIDEEDAYYILCDVCDDELEDLGIDPDSVPGRDTLQKALNMCLRNGGFVNHPNYGMEV